MKKKPKKRESKALCDWRYQAMRACRALDAIYNDSEAGRRLVLEHYGPHHTTIYTEEREAQRTQTRKESAK